jgi:hypothetical protein
MKQRRAGVAWKDDGSSEGIDFKQDILPGLQTVLVRIIAEAMGSSLFHGSKGTNDIGKTCWIWRATRQIRKSANAWSRLLPLRGLDSQEGSPFRLLSAE